MIQRGAGNDFILSKAARTLIDSGDGNDTVALSDDRDTYRDKIDSYGYFKNSTVFTGKGNDYVYLYEYYDDGRGFGVFVNTGDGADTVNSEGRYSGGGDSLTIDGGAGQDSIRNYQGHYSSLYGGEGNDTINNEGSNYVTIDGGTDDDFITNNGKNNTISGGAGNDSISNSGANVSIDAGKGDDSITNSGANVLFVYS